MLPERLSKRSVQPVGVDHDFDWSFTDLAGRVAEIAGGGDGAALTTACALVRDAQCHFEPVAWIGCPESIFYPPDVAEGGIDLDALIVIRAPQLESALRAADRLLRSTAFGLVIVDLGKAVNLPLPFLARLSGLARRHRSALVFLTEKTDAAASLGPLVSLVITSCRQGIAGDRFSCRLEVVKDKHGAPARQRSMDCRGPSGLRCHP